MPQEERSPFPVYEPPRQRTGGLVAKRMKEQQTEKRDWKISATLLAVWLVALYFVAGERDDIPLSMIGMATIFFIILIPAMNDLVRSIETRVNGESDNVAER